MELGKLLYETTGLSSGIVYSTGVLKGNEVLQMVADCRAQETIRQMTERVLEENRTETVLTKPGS